MSLQGLELLRDLTEITNASQALDNLCADGATPFNSEDFKVFRCNKKNVSVLSYIPNNFTFSVSAFEPIDNQVSLKEAYDVQSDIVNLNISIGDKISGEGIDDHSVIEKLNIYIGENNIFNLPKTEIVLNKVINVDTFNGSALITKQNNATIDENFLTLGVDIQYSFYNGDKITKVLYPLSSSALPLLGTENEPLYVVDLFIDNEERINFGLSQTVGGSRINLTSLNPLSVINLYRNNEVVQSDILNILPPSSRESNTASSIDNNTDMYVIELSYDDKTKFNDDFNNLQQAAGNHLALLDTKIDLTKDVVTNSNITINGTVKITDPDNVNDNTISNEIYTPSVYITDPIRGDIDNKVRIFSTFESPWVTTTNTLSTNKDIVVGDLILEGSIAIDNLEINSVTDTLLSGKYNYKLPIYVEDSTGAISTYYLLASAAR